MQSNGHVYIQLGCSLAFTSNIRTFGKFCTTPSIVFNPQPIPGEVSCASLIVEQSSIRTEVDDYENAVSPFYWLKECPGCVT